MPLNLQVEREGKKLKTSWDYFVLSCIYTAAMKEASPNEKVNEKYTYGTIPEGAWVDWSMMPIYYMNGCPLLEKGRQVLEQDHLFRTTHDGEPREFLLKKGDKLTAFRSGK